MVEDPLSENILRNMYVGKNMIEVTVEPDPDEEDAKRLKFEGLEAPPETEEKKKEEEAVAGSETT